MGQRLRSSRAASAKPRNRPQRRAQAGTAATARILPGGGALTPSLMRKLQASAGNAAVAQLAVQRCGPGGCGGKCCGGEEEEGVHRQDAGEALSSPRFAGTDRFEQAFRNAPPIGVGENGGHVGVLQQALIDAGFPIPAGVTSHFGQQTLSAVTSFQRAFSLKPDGKVGHLTLGKLDNLTGGTLTVSDGPAADLVDGPSPTAERQLTGDEQKRVDALVLQVRELVSFARVKLIDMRSARGLVTSDPLAFLLFHSKTHHAVERWLRVFDPKLDAYWAVVDAAIGLLGSHMAVSTQERFTRNPTGDPFCPGTADAATAGTHVGLCDGFFGENALCQRDELLHEFFHSLGIHHGGPANDPNACVSRKDIDSGRALDSCDNLAMLVSEIGVASFDACGKSCFGDDPGDIPPDSQLIGPAPGPLPDLVGSAA
jgi:peptidoglycan hydrolase-like protein with peptidoglycan-binding domain